MISTQLALVFDAFGHPNQLYIANNYKRLSQIISFDAFAAEIINSNDIDVKPLKLNGRLKKISQLPSYFLNGAASHVSLRTYVRYPNLLRRSYHAYHFLNAQQYPVFRSLLPMNCNLAFSFRGYETLVRPSIDADWKVKLTRIYEDATLLHFVSNYIMAEAIRLGAPVEKCVVVHRSVDIDFFNAVPRNPTNTEVLNILSVGRLSWQKGYPYALEAIQLLKKKGNKICYHIVGDGADLAMLRFHVTRLGIEDQVVFHGQQSRSTIKRHFENADIYLHASLTEAMPNAILEASSMSLPIVATAAGGAPEAVLDGESGFVVAPANAEKIAEALTILIGSKELRQKFGFSARKYMEQKFHPDIETSKWLSFYEKILS